VGVSDTKIDLIDGGYRNKLSVGCSLCMSFR
jgi:hypothetical protein